MILLWNSAEMNVKITLVSETGEREDLAWQADRNLARDMLAYIRDLLTERTMSFADITAIGVFRGPGSYTGLRIGLTVLNTFAADRHIPIVGETGESWQDASLSRIAAGDNDKIVLPEYGGDAHITKPRK